MTAVKTWLKQWICILSNFIAFFGTAQLVKCRRLLLELNSQGLYPCSNRERKICRRMTTSSIKRHIGTFHVVVVQWTVKKCTKKRDTRAELLVCSQDQLFVCFFFCVVVVVVASSSYLLKVPIYTVVVFNSFGRLVFISLLVSRLVSSLIRKSNSLFSYSC